MRTRRIAAGMLVLALATTAACGSSAPSSERSEGASTPSSGPSRDGSDVDTESSNRSSAAGQSANPKKKDKQDRPGRKPGAGRTPDEAQRLRSGIDVSHHQGAIDWSQVAAARVDGRPVDFAYLKATEGSGFTDSRFRSHAAQARAAGLDVGGYHYFTLCSPGAAQAEHFADTLEASGRTNLPPVVDLEYLGNCDPGPDRATLLREVRAFIDVVEKRTGRTVVLYQQPRLAAEYRLADDLGARPQWIRKWKGGPPAGDWSLWQTSESGSVAGVSGPVDLDVMRGPLD